MSAFRDGQDTTERPYDKVEISPNNRATCKLCKNKIQKGDCRIGIHYVYRGYKWSAIYYHRTCVSSRGASNIFNENKALNFKSQSASKRSILSIEEQIEIESCYYQQQKQTRQTIVDSRSELRELLRSTRKEFARQLNQPVFCIFKDTVLDSLVEQMPLNQTALLTVCGFGLVKCASLGPVVLAVINQYKRQIDQQSGTHQHQSIPPRTNNNRLHDVDDDEVIVEHEVSIEDLIKNRIKESEKRGEIIEF